MNTGFNYFPEKLYSKPVKMTDINSGFSFMSHPQEIFYSIKDGNWTDANMWETVSGRTGKFPSATDDVYVRHNVSLNTTCSVNNFFVSGTFKADNSSRVITVNGNIQSTGIVDFTGSNINLILMGVNNSITSFIAGFSTISYNGLSNQNVMNLAYYNLWIQGSGTKYATGNTAISNNTTIRGNLELLSYNYTFNTISNAFFPFASKLSKSGSGTVLFTGLVSSNFGSTIDFSGGNPIVEIRNGFNCPTTFNSGTGQWNFTTASQSIFGTGIFTSPVLINGAINLTIDVNATITISNSIDGDNAGSTLINVGKLYFNTTTVPMATLGTFTRSASTNIIGYIMNGNFTIPYNSYQGLLTAGTGIKTLSANTTVNTTLSVGVGSSTAVDGIELSTFDFTVTGIFTHQGLLSKSGAGNVIFIAAPQSSGFSKIDFSGGNPTVEIRNGWNQTGALNFIPGTGIWTSSTNNQTININNGALQDLLISGAITVTITTGALALTFNGTINGNNAASILDNRGVIHYKNATAPMVTGKLYCNQAANTWFYDLAGNQDIQVPGDPTPGYSNLTLAGSGAKKLLGNVSVKGTYTLTAPATLNTNGFALTNP